MTREGQLDRLDQTLESLSRHWGQKHAVAASRQNSLSASPRETTIALSREAGTQGTAVARAIGSVLNWAVYDQELLGRIAQDLGVQEKLLASVDEKGMNWLQEAFASFVAVPFVSDGAYVQHLVKTILALGIHGECVIVGRGSAFILPTATTLRVRLIAPLKERVAAMSQERSVSQAEAARQIELLDRQRNRFVQDHFFKDSTDLHNYDMVLDFARFGIDGCAKLIADAARRLHRTADAGRLFTEVQC